MGENSTTAIVDPDSGAEVVEMNLPKIFVDTAIGDAIVIDCELEVN